MTGTPHRAIPFRPTITDALAAELREQIRSGLIAPGSRLRQTEIAAQFNVSTTPVREAFAALKRDGFLVSSPHRGVIVFQPTIADLEETYEIRMPLEALATEKGVENLTDEDIDELRMLLADMRAVVDDPGAYAPLNARFHAVIYQAAGRPKLARLIADLREESAAYLRLYATISPRARDTQEDHALILAACEARAPRPAARAMIKHLQHTVEHVSGGLTEQAG